MDFKIVSIEMEDPTSNSVYGSTGIMINKKYTIITANIISRLIDYRFAKYLETLKKGKIYKLDDEKIATSDLRIFWKEKGDLFNKYQTEAGSIFAIFLCEHLKILLKQIVIDWSIDTPVEKNSAEILSVFFVLKTGTTGTIDDFKNCLKQWWNLVQNETINQLDDILIRSAAFGNKIFLDSINKGIVSTIIGQNNCLIVSDCSLTPGSEGSAMYKNHSNVPLGIVISTSSWWKGDWTSLTLIADARSILYEFQDDFKITTRSTITQNLLANVGLSVMKVYCGSNWGTAIIVNQEGILLTNSHVVDFCNPINLYWRGKAIKGKLIYKTPDDEVFDLAVLECDPDFLKSNACTTLKYSKEPPVVGEEVYAAGFALFSQNISTNLLISKGCVIQYYESMVRTSCCINPGMSGGAILNRYGEIIAVIVCNSRLNENVYPRFNMAIPYTIIQEILDVYFQNKDSTILNKLYSDDPRITSVWKAVSAKL